MSGPTETRSVDVAVIGAGIIGLGIAWAAARSGRTVAVIDPAPAQGATYAAAGMLAAVSELHFKEEELLKLTLKSAALYPGFIASLGADAAAVGFRTPGTLVLGVDPADSQALFQLRELQISHGLQVTSFTVREARAHEPLLSPNISAAFRIQQDHQVDPRLLAARLQAALAELAHRNGWAHQPGIRQSALCLLHKMPGDSRSRVTGVALDDGSTVAATEVIVANAGAASSLGGMPDDLALPLRPVHGDILRLRAPGHLQPFLNETVRGLVRGVPVYLVPRSDGTVVLGATQREHGTETASVGGVYQLLRDGQALVPAVAELELIEVTARARPGTPDNAPLLGRVASAAGGQDIPGLIVATGFFRHGVLLTPVAAEICVQLFDNSGDSRWQRFRPDRFSPLISKEHTRA
ncbi:glycine oxidase ThiO [Subtercola vilae]|uniref:glycine oxidase n=1 Tax=Subtercola vilae TaxID=2056433 RepID=A0A4T2C269_9MICO|nr:glycine oxidase ThiO [Subtercola vilae]TIH36178.1 glycine oxidase ThiO [Subtercola vilae]